MTQLAALSYIEELEQWTANNVVNSYISGDYTVREMFELELEYPGHFGQGFWILTGEMRITDMDYFGGCDVHLYNEDYDSTFGVSQGYTYDTSWKSFSIFSGWMSDQPSTMKLMLRLYTTTDEPWDIVELRNVRLAFVQLNDANGVAIVGRDWPKAGYHVKKMAWDYSEFTTVSVAPGGSNTLVSMTSANVMSNTATYVSFMHINGLDNYGGQDDTMKTYLKFEDGSTASNTDGIVYTRPMGGYYPSYTWITKRPGNTSITTSIVAHNDASSNTNMELDIYGGWFMMLLEKANTDLYFEHDQANTAISGSTLAYSTPITGALAPSTRYLVFASGRHNVNTGNVTSVVSLGSHKLGEYEAFDYYGDPNHGQFTTFGNVVLQQGANLTLTQNASTTGATGGPLSAFILPVARDYVNSATALPSTAVNLGTGTQLWSNTSHALSANLTHYAQQSLASAAASNRYLSVTNFGFDQHIPEGSTIGYVWMYPVCRRGGAYDNAVWDDIRMVAAGSAVGASVAWSTTLAADWMYEGPPHNLGCTTYWTLDNTPAAGGTSSRDGLWGYRPTAAQVRASDFGFQLRARRTTPDGVQVHVAYVACVIYYRAPGETFARSVTATAGNIGMTVDRDHDTERAASELTLTETLAGEKAFDHTEALAGFTVGEPTGNKDVGQNKLHSVTGIPARLASALEVFKTSTASLTPSSKKATVPTAKATANVALTASALSRGTGKSARGIAFLFENRRFMIEQNTRSTAATATASGRKGIGKLRSATLASTVSHLVGVGKNKLRTVTSTVTRTRQIARSFSTTSSMTVALNKIKNTAYYITESIVQAIVPTLQKAIVPTPKATGGYTMTAHFAYGFGLFISGFVGLTMTAAAGAKQIGLNRLNPITSTLKRLIGVNRSDAVITTVTPSSQKAVVAEVNTASYSMSAAAVKAVAKVRAHSLTTAITARKAASQAVDALTSTVTVAASKAVAALSALTSTVTLGGSKTISRITKRTVATVVTRQRAIGRARARVMSTVVKSRRAIGSFLAAPLVATATLRKGISHRFARVSIGSVVSLVTAVETLLKKIYFTFREVGFMSLVNGLTFKLGDSATTSHEQIYADFETARLGETEVVEAALAEPEVIEATLTTEPEIIKVVL